MFSLNLILGRFGNLFFIHSSIAVIFVIIILVVY